MHKERIERSVETYRAHNSKLIAGVWIVERKIVERIAADETAYSMDYGIVRVIAKYPFPKPLRSDSKQVTEALQIATEAASSV